MARFTNYATLTYNGGTIDSNTVTGELIEILTASKEAISESYKTGDDVTYVISIVNSGAEAVTGLTVTDNLGAYTLDTATLYPLSYVDGTVRYYVNGVLQAAPTVVAGPPLSISGISVPAGGNAIIVYEARVTDYAPLGTDAAITNTATVSGGGLSSTVTAEETVNAYVGTELNITKSVSPITVAENGQLTYTFVVENYGSTAATATDELVLTDVFNPVLNSLAVTYEGASWTEGTDYTYDAASGTFATVAGNILVPAATYTQNTDGTWTVTPGTATITVSGTL